LTYSNSGNIPFKPYNQILFWEKGELLNNSIGEILNNPHWRKRK